MKIKQLKGHGDVCQQIYTWIQKLMQDFSPLAKMFIYCVLFVFHYEMTIRGIGLLLLIDRVSVNHIEYLRGCKTSYNKMIFISKVNQLRPKVLQLQVKIYGCVL